MKIVKSIRDIHRSCQPKYKMLKLDVEEVLKSMVGDSGWLYSSRIKTLDSFAQKIETGSVVDPMCLEDFFACTIVVPTVAEIGSAEEMVYQLYDRRERRPIDDNFTRKSSSEFVFDDLRLYVARRPRISGKDPNLDGVLFEVQIKTILQHAWSVATHDLIYKTDTVSWPLERVAFQVKAMLEHAEVSVSEAVTLARAPGIAKEDQQTREVLEIIDHARQLWAAEQLPRDVRRLAVSVLALLRLCGVSVGEFRSVVDAERGRVGGVPRELSPYAFTVQALARSSLVDFRGALEGETAHPRVVVIHSGMDVPEWMRGGHSRILDLNETVVPA